MRNLLGFWEIENRETPNSLRPHLTLSETEAHCARNTAINANQDTLCSPHARLAVFLWSQDAQCPESSRDLVIRMNMLKNLPSFLWSRVSVINWRRCQQAEDLGPQSLATGCNNIQTVGSWDWNSSADIVLFYSGEDIYSAAVIWNAKNLCVMSNESQWAVRTWQAAPRTRYW